MTNRRGRGDSGGASFAVRRKPSARPSRRRLGLITTLVLVAALGVGGIYWAAHSELLAVTRIETGNYRFTSPAALDAALGPFLGRNLLTVSKSEVADSLATLVWVRDLRIGRRLPGTLAVDFREWRPLAVLAQADLPREHRSRTWVLGDNGALLEFPAELEIPALPTLVGLSIREAGSTLAADSTAAAGLLDLFDAIAAVGLETVAPVDFVVVGPQGCAIVLADGQGRLQVGRKEFGPRLERYITARPHLEPGLEVDLRFADRVTVRRPGRTAHGSG